MELIKKDMRNKFIYIIGILCIISCTTTNDQSPNFELARQQAKEGIIKLDQTTGRKESSSVISDSVELNSIDEIPYWIKKSGIYKSGGFDEAGIGYAPINNNDPLAGENEAFLLAVDRLAQIMGVQIRAVVKDYYTDTNGDEDVSYSHEIIVKYIHELKGYKTEKYKISEGEFSGHWVKLTLPIEAIYGSNLSYIRLNNKTGTEIKYLKDLDNIIEILTKTTFANPNGLHKVMKRSNPSAIVLPYQGEYGNLGEVFKIIEELSGGKLEYNEIFDFNSVVRELIINEELSISEQRSLRDYSRSLDVNMYNFSRLNERDIKSWLMDEEYIESETLLSLPFSLFIFKTALNDGLLQVDVPREYRSLFTDLFKDIIGINPKFSSGSGLNLYFTLVESDNNKYTLSYRFSSGGNNKKQVSIEDDTELQYSNQLKVSFRELLFETAQKIINVNTRFIIADEKQDINFSNIFEVSRDKQFAYKLLSEEMLLYDNVAEWYSENGINSDSRSYNRGELRIVEFIDTNIGSENTLNIYDFNDFYSVNEVMGRESQYYLKALLDSTLSLNKDSAVSMIDYLFIGFKNISNIRGTESGTLKNILEDQLTSISYDSRNYWNLMTIYWGYIINDIEPISYELDQLLTDLSSTEYGDLVEGYKYVLKRQDDTELLENILFKWDETIVDNATHYPLWLSDLYGLYGYYAYNSSDWDTMFNAYIKSYITSYGEDTKILNLIANNRDEWRRFIRNTVNYKYLEIFVSLFEEIFYDELNSIKDKNRYQNVKSDVRL